ncbi:MAG: proton-conducting transporter membrane subunit [Sphaerochaeta sp.]
MNTLSNILFAPVYLPLLGAALILVCKSFFRTAVRRMAEYLGILIGLVLPVVLALTLKDRLSQNMVMEAVAGSWAKEMGIIYRFDGLSLLMILLAAAVTIPAWMYSRKVGPAHSSFTALLLVQNAAIAAISMTADLFNLFVCLEVMGVVAYVLIAGNQKGSAVYASFSYLMLSSTAMVFFLLGTFGLYRLTGSLSYEAIAHSLAEGQNQGYALLCLILLIVPVLLRVAVLPLSLWLVDAHSKAPHAVSALLSGVLLKIPLFALVRVFALVPGSAQLALPISYAGALTALFGVILALAQSDAKQLLAYHSISQIGYVVTAWGLALQAGVHTQAGALLLSVSFFHAFSHALFKALLFLSVGTATDAGANRNVYTLRGASRSLKGEGERLPITLLCYLVGALSIMAIPPFNGYFSKNLLTYAIKGGVHYPILTLAGVGTVASFLKLSRIFLPAKMKLEILHPSLRPRFPLSLHTGLLMLALMCILTGIFAPEVFAFITELLSAQPVNGFDAHYFFKQETLAKTFYTTLAGIVLFLFILTKPGAWILHLPGRYRARFSDLFFGFSLALALLLLVARVL